jgi:hypothetical protein
MGRWAYFHSTTDSKSAEAETINYKFWVACQSSEIPWASETKRYFIREYDENNDYDLTPEQDKFWRENQDDYFEGYFPDLSAEVRDIIELISNEEYIATDTDSDLADYWAERDDIAKHLGIDWEYNDKKTLQDNMEDFSNYLWNQYKQKHPEGEHTDEEREYADLAIKTLICYFLEKHGSYECVFEC